MLGQSFVWGDLAVVGLLTVMEVLLSADNALVLAIMVKHLRADLQKKALLYGLGGAFIFRFVAIEALNRGMEEGLIGLGEHCLVAQPQRGDLVEFPDEKGAPRLWEVQQVLHQADARICGELYVKRLQTKLEWQKQLTQKV